MYSVMPHPQHLQLQQQQHQHQYPQTQSYCWTTNSLSTSSSTTSCSEEDEMDSSSDEIIGSFDMKSENENNDDNGAFDLFDEMIKTEAFVEQQQQQNLHLHLSSAPHSQQSSSPMAMAAVSVAPLALCSETSPAATNLSSSSAAFNREKAFPTRMISPSMIKSEMSPCFEDQMHIPQHVVSPPQHHHHQSHHQQQQMMHQSYPNNNTNNNMMHSPTNNNNNDQQVDIYRDLILKHLIQDIKTTCSKLYLPTNPLYWNIDHANRWIVDMCNQFNLPTPIFPLNMNGPALLEISAEELCSKMPGGDILHAQLHLWKTASENNNNNQSEMQNNNCGGNNNVGGGSLIHHHRSSDSTCSSNNGWMSPTTPTKTTSISMDDHHYNVMNYSNAYEQRSQEAAAAAAQNNMNMYYQSMQQQHHHHHQQHQSAAAQNQNHGSYPQMIPQIHNQQHEGQIASRQQQQFFMYNQQILPSPSDSEISSNSSTCIPDGTDDDCSDINYISHNSAPSNYMVATQQQQPICQQQQQPMNSPINNNVPSYSNNMPQMQNNGNNMAAMPPQLGVNTAAASVPAVPTVVPFVAAYSRNTGTVHLWHFIRELLDQPKQYGSCVRWVDREDGTFKIESSHHLARYWGQRKNRSQMNYDKLSRSLRQYYKKGIIQKPEKKQRLVYKFLPPYNL